MEDSKGWYILITTYFCKVTLTQYSQLLDHEIYKSFALQSKDPVTCQKTGKNVLLYPLSLLARPKTRTSQSDQYSKYSFLLPAVISGHKYLQNYLELHKVWFIFMGTWHNRSLSEVCMPEPYNRSFDSFLLPIIVLSGQSSQTHEKYALQILFLDFSKFSSPSSQSWKKEFCCFQCSSSTFLAFPLHILTHWSSDFYPHKRFLVVCHPNFFDSSPYNTLFGRLVFRNLHLQIATDQLYSWNWKNPTVESTIP